MATGCKIFTCFKRSSLRYCRDTAGMTRTSSSADKSGQETEGTAEYESSFELDDLQKHVEPPYILSRGSKLSKKQKEEVTELIREICSEFPLFVAIMRPSNVTLRSPSLVIPIHYGDAHFPHNSQIVTLQRPGKDRKWHPKFNINKDGSSYKYVLAGSWLHFVHDNHVHQGDICVFQPMKDASKKFVVTVHLLHESRAYSLGGRTRNTSPDAKRVSYCEARIIAEVTLATPVKEDPVDGEGCNYGHTVHQRLLECDDSEGPSKHLYMLSGHAHLTKEQMDKVEERVHRIRSEAPIYVATMIRVSVGANSLYTIVFDKPYATEYLPDGEQNLTLMRIRKKKKWKVKMNPRSGEEQILTLGWHKFVGDNLLAIEDICLFQLIKNERSLTMAVDIIPHRTNSPVLDCYDCKVKQEPDTLDDSEGPVLLSVVLSGTDLTLAQEKIVKGKVVSIQSEMPIFVAAMNKNIIGGEGIYALDFNTSYAAPYLPDGKQTLTLHRIGWCRSWHAEVHNRRMVDGELCEFAHDSRLNIGDICLFELADIKRLAMTVHIIRSEQYCVALSAGNGLMMI